MMTDRSSEGGASAIDFEVLEDLARDAGADAMPTLIASFVRDCTRREAEISAAADAKDLETLEAQSHALTSSARTFGALILADLTRAIEDACRQGWADDAFARAAVLPDVVADARRIMLSESERYGALGPQD